MIKFKNEKAKKQFKTDLLNDYKEQENELKEDAKILGITPKSLYIERIDFRSFDDSCLDSYFEYDILNYDTFSQFIKIVYNILK